MFTLQQLIEDGNLKLAASSSGGEYKGLCILCNSTLDDGFCAWPHHPKSPTVRYHCRKCSDKSDTGVGFLMKQGATYRDACKMLSVQPTLQAQAKWRRTAQGWTPKPAGQPSEIWMARASEFLLRAQRNLEGSLSARQYLNSRGFTDASLANFKFGYWQGWTQHDPVAWGLDSQSFWTPEGIVIPTFFKNKLVSIKIRQTTPSDPKRRYMALSGGSVVPTLLLREGNSICMVVESELCAYLLAQECGHFLDVIALPAGNKPDRYTTEILRRADLILLALDNDDAGRKAVPWWRSQFADCIGHSVPGGCKDPTDCHIAGYNLSAWIKGALPQRLHKLLFPVQEQVLCPLAKLHSNGIYAEPSPNGLTLIADYALSEGLHGQILLWASQHYASIMDALLWAGEHPSRKVTLTSLNAYHLPRE